MTALVALARQILIAVLGNSNLTQQILRALGVPAQEDTVVEVGSDVAFIKGLLLDLTVGLQALHDLIDATNTNVIVGFTTVEAAISNLPQVGDPVVLPTTPPSGYGSPTDQGLFDAVWLGLHSPDVVTPYQWIRDVGTRTDFINGFATLAQADGNFSYFNQAYDEFGIAPSFYPVFDLALVGPTDTLLTFLETCNPGATCFWSPSEGLQVQVNGDSGDGTAHFLTTWNDASFQQLKANFLALAATPAPPVWPGIDLVTLGSDTAIASQQTVTGPMDGVIVLISDVTVNKPNLQYDTFNAWKFIGSLAFVSDNGDVEEFQLLGFNDALYCPKSMSRAASVVVRADPSVVGTITPWVVA